ncbi:MAG: HPr(Ser) kinase/phosphatase, partial [Gammaproteobacteria bacterium]|nr:HPr(Ser) kinase/phosphatase [Gammaproteobacteria bacterium]
MSTTLTIREFHKRFQKRLKLSFASGQVGLDREINMESGDNISYVTVDYLNIIRPSSVVIIGKQESSFLASRDIHQQQDIFEKLCHKSLSTIILSREASSLDNIIKYCSNSAIAVFKSELDDSSLLRNARYFLNQALTKTTTRHGVFVEVHSIGTFIVGESGVGKSELALALISRGHRLIADDIVEFSSMAPGIIDGIHPGLSNDFMEVRGVGILNIRAMFGSNALRRNKTLRLIVNMIPFTMENSHQFDRLGNSQKTQSILGADIPEMTLPVAPGRNLAVLV